MARAAVGEGCGLVYRRTGEDRSEQSPLRIDGNEVGGASGNDAAGAVIEAGHRCRIAGEQAQTLVYCVPCELNEI